MVIFVTPLSPSPLLISPAAAPRRTRTQPNRTPHALKGQKLLAQGIALGMIANSKAPCKGKSLPTHQSSLIPEHEFFIIFHII